MEDWAQPQWSGDCQDVAEVFYNKFADRKNSQFALGGREPCCGLANSRSRALKSRIFLLVRSRRR